MEERLKRLKKAMNQTAFQKVEFTENQQQQVRNQLKMMPLKHTILSMLTEMKSGVELTQMLHVRGNTQIVDNEGLIYAILHEAEQQQWLASEWQNGVKYYQITKQGEKQLLQNEGATKLTFKERLMGVRLHVE